MARRLMASRPIANTPTATAPNAAAPSASAIMLVAGTVLARRVTSRGIGDLQVHFVNPTPSRMRTDIHDVVTTDPGIMSVALESYWCLEQVPSYGVDIVPGRGTA